MVAIVIHAHRITHNYQNKYGCNSNNIIVILGTFINEISSKSSIHSSVIIIFVEIKPAVNYNSILFL